MNFDHLGLSFRKRKSGKTRGKFWVSSFADTAGLGEICNFICLKQ